MNMPSALDGIIAQLIRRGLPAEYAERAGAELVDHYGDLVTEQRAAGLDEPAAAVEAARRLGDSRLLVRKTVREYQRRYWCGRWPLLTFLLGPFFTIAALWLTIGIAMSAMSTVAGWCGLASDGRMDRGEFLGSYGLWIGCAMLSPCLVAAFHWRLAKRAAMTMVWPLVSCFLLAFLAGQLIVTIDPAKATVTAGMVYPPSLVWFTSHPAQLVQFTLPIVVVLSLLARQRWEAGALRTA